MPITIDGTNGISDVRSTTDGTAATPAIRGTDTNTGIFFPAVDTIAFAEGGAEVMRIDSSGNVGMGTSSPSQKVEVAGTVSNTQVKVSATTGQPSFALNNTGGVFGVYIDNSAATGFGKGAYSRNIYSDGNYPVVFWTNDTERMRISSNGNVGIGVTSPGKKLSVAGPSNVDLSYFESTSGTGWSVGPVASAGRFNWYQENAAADRMFLSTAGALFNATGTYGTISDVSLKENIVDATPKLADLMQVKVRNFNLKADPDKRKIIGVVAQELEEVFPGLIEEIANRTVQKDGSFLEQNVKAVKYSVLTTILIKAIQELKTIVDQQSTELDSVKATVDLLSTELATLKAQP